MRLEERARRPLGQDDVATWQLADLLGGEPIGVITEVHDVHAVEFGGEDGVVACGRAAMFVAVAADAGDQHRLHLVLAWPLKDHGAVEARSDGGAVIARGESPLHARKRGVVRVAQGHDVGAHAAPGWPHD